MGRFAPGEEEQQANFYSTFFVENLQMPLKSFDYFRRTDLQETTIQLSTGDELTFYHNLPLTGIDNLQHALTVWMSKTDDYSAENFCEYINGKREQGLCRYYAFTSQNHYDSWMENLSDEELEEVARLYDDGGGLEQEEGGEFDGMTASDFQDDWKINFKVHQCEVKHNNQTYIADIKPFEATTQAERAEHKIDQGEFLIHLFDGKQYKNFKITSDIDEECNLIWNASPEEVVEDKTLVSKLGEEINKTYA